MIVLWTEVRMLSLLTIVSSHAEETHRHTAFDVPSQINLEHADVNLPAFDFFPPYILLKPSEPLLTIGPRGKAEDKVQFPL